MSYRDDLIVRLQQDGLWDQLTSQQQARFLRLTDEQARQMMIMDDQWEMGDDEAVELFGLLSLARMILSFKGALVQHGGEDAGKLSRAGRLLAEFFIELSEQGLSPDDVDEGLRSLSPLCIAALKTVYSQTD